MTSLQDEFIKALQDISGVSFNSYLQLMRRSVEQVSNFSRVDEVLSEYNEKLVGIVSCRNFALDPEKTNEFAQVLGEAHFYLLCKDKSLDLTRIKEGIHKTPDFKIEQDEIDFEVKTLSVVSGGIGLKNSLMDSLDAQIEIERQTREAQFN